MLDMTAEYKADFYSWAKHNAQLLRNGQVDQADWANIAEALDSMSNSERRFLKSHLTDLLMHLLKWQYQPQRRGRSWQLSIHNSRKQIRYILDDSPSLEPQLPDLLNSAYADAREDASLETELDIATFPETCPFRVLEDALNKAFWPEN